MKSDCPPFLVPRQVTPRWVRIILLAILVALPVVAGAQTILLSEGFEGAFPGAWNRGDSNAANGVVTWKDEFTTFGTVLPRTGSWKGYCAGISNGVAVATAGYAVNMQGYMSQPLNLAGYTGANVDFWYDIPSIETNFDFFRVYMDSTLLFETTKPTAGWTFLSFPLNAYLGGTHTLKFEFDSDFSVTYEGAYLDDIRVSGANQPLIDAFQSLENINYSGYVLDSDTFLGRSNIDAQAVFTVENFSGTNRLYTNVLSYTLINATSNTAHPIYDLGNTATNSGYTYNITNIIPLASGTNLTVSNIAYIRPAAWMSQFDQFYVQCKMITNGVVAQTLTTSPTNFYHFTNTVGGDAAYNVLLNLTNTAWSRTYEVETIPGQNAFRVAAGYEERRWDDFNASQTATNIPVVFNYTLRDSTGSTVPLVSNSSVFLDTVTNYGVVFIFQVPYVLTASHVLNVRPSVQLDSVNKTYYLTVTLSHTNNPVTGEVLVADTQQTGTNELLHFNGNLFFGPIGTTLSALAGPSPPANAPSGGVIPTTLTGAGGYVTAKTDHSYSAGAPLSVNLLPNGDATVTAGSVTLAAPSPDNDSIAGVRFQRGLVTLSPSGASGNLTAFLPSGFGYRTDTNSLVFFSTVPFPSVTLTAALDPVSDLTYAPGTTIYAAEESKPAYLLSDRIIWHVTAGKLNLPPTGAGAVYVRQKEYAYLASVSNNLVDPPNMGDKRSNDKYWLFLTGPSAVYLVRPDGGGNSLLTAGFKFSPGQFLAHFPYDTYLQWTGNGNMTVTDDLVPPASGSGLGGASDVAVPYTRDCPDCGGGGSGITTPTISVSNSVFSFTPDGGLAATGSTVPTTDLQWGYIGAPVSDFAQQAFQFKSAAFHMPGVFVRGDKNLLPAVQAPSTILYTGFKADDLTVAERPLSAAYSQGLADYAGLNFRCLTDGAHAARSTIAGTPNINWQPDGRSKYYVRYAGISGIHEAVPGSFPSSLTLWGYKFTFTSYGLSYLDSQNKDSVTDGAVSLPYPAQIVQNFTGLNFSCLGSPTGGDLPPNEGFKVLAYWLADIKVHSMKFVTPAPCSPSTGYLVLGLEGYGSHIPTAMYGEVGFKSDGDQIPPSLGLPGITSRLKVPNLISMDGPNHTTYSFTPVQDAYYNTYHNAPSAPTAGWISIFGKLDVPFFEDMQVHFQTSCHTNGVTSSNSPIYLSGGWPRPGTSNPNYGWLDPASRTPFETNLFDWANLGWPGSGGGLTIDKYRDNSADQMYHPRAQRLWLGVVEFDYPLSWNTSLRSFKASQSVSNDLLVVSVEHQVKYMDAKHAEIDFGAQYDGLPQISVANLAFNAIDENLGVGDAIVKAASQPVEDVLSTGLDEMDQLLDTQMKRMMDGVFDKTVDPVIDQFYNQLHADWNGMSYAQRQQFALHVQANGLAYLTTPLTTTLTQMGSGVNQASNLIGQVRGYIRDATNAIESVVGVISTTTNGQALGTNVVGLIGKAGGSRPVVPQLLQSLVGDIAPQFIDAVIGPTVSNALQSIDPALSEITDTLDQTKNDLAQVDAALATAGDFTSQINDILTSAGAELNSVSTQVTSDVGQYFGGFNYAVDDPFVHVSAADLKQFIRQKVEDEFFASAAAAQIQTALRQRLYDVDATMKGDIDSVFQQLNGALRGLISQSLAQLDNSINQCLGDAGTSIGAGKLNGHALIDGDSLKELRIDGHFEFKVPDDMEVDAFLLIKELNSDGSAGCSSSKAPYTEVTIGATHVPLGFEGNDLTANVEAKFTFDGTVPFPVNLAGQIALNGELDFQAFQLHDLAAAVAFGKYENYLALKGGVKFSGYDFSGAIFFGRTCSLDPLILIDPDVASVLGNPPFTGAYCYAQGWIPISEDLLGIPASCLFEISAGIGAGAFYFAEGPTYGGKMFLGVSGQLLCIVSIEGDITMIGVKHGADLNFKGHGHFDADLGPCPFCITLSKDVDITYIHSWQISF